MKKVIGIVAVIALLSSCGSGNYIPCPAYGNIEQSQEEFYTNLDCENCDENN